MDLEGPNEGGGLHCDMLPEEKRDFLIYYLSLSDSVYDKVNCVYLILEL